MFQVLEIRCTYDQLTKVFTLEELERHGLEQSLDKFLLKSLSSCSKTDINRDTIFCQFIYSPLAFSPCDTDHWNKAISLFNERIRAAENSAASHLRLSLSYIMGQC